MHELLAALGKSIASLLIGIAAIISPPVPQYTTTFPVVASTSLSDLPAPEKAKLNAPSQPVIPKPVQTKAAVVPVEPDPYQDAWDALNADIQHEHDLQDRDQKIMDDWAKDTKNQVQQTEDDSTQIAAMEDQIRAEVQAAGGYVTASQLRSMAMDRLGY